MSDVTLPDGRLLVGDCRTRLAEMDAGSVHCVVTSPPYFALRQYSGVAPSLWGGRSDCTHSWSEDRYYTEKTAAVSSASAFSEPGEANKARLKEGRWRSDSTCSLCGAWSGCLGLEPTLDHFVANLVEVFAAVKRVLRDDGVMVVNLGDSMSASRGVANGTRVQTLPPKNLSGVPFRVALALQADGWIWRSCMPWVKFGSAMPESVTDRPASAIEYVFLFAKSETYYWDAVPIRKKFADDRLGNPGRLANNYAAPAGRNDATTLNQDWRRGQERGGRSYRNSDPFLSTLDAQIRHHHAELMRLEKLRHGGGLMTDEDGEPMALLVNPEAQQSSKQGVDHYASFPRNLVRPFVLAGASERGVCACGAPWERVTDGARSKVPVELSPKRNGRVSQGLLSTKTGLQEKWSNPIINTLGWSPTCSCPAAPSIPAVVLDPFLGSGTTAIVARELGRHFIGIDASAEYVALAARRLAGVMVGALAANESVPTLTQMGIEDAV